MRMKNDADKQISAVIKKERGGIEDESDSLLCKGKLGKTAPTKDA